MVNLGEDRVEVVIGARVFAWLVGAAAVILLAGLLPVLLANRAVITVTLRL